MRLHVYTDNKTRADGSKSLMLRLYANKKPLTIFMSFLSVNPVFWDSVKERCIISKDYPQGREINALIGRIISAVETQFIKAIDLQLGNDQLKELIQKAIDGIIGVKTEKVGLFDAIDEYINANPRGLKRRTLFKYSALKAKLIAFDRAKVFHVHYQAVNTRFAEAFTRWMEGNGYLNDTISKTLDNLKTIMRWSLDAGYHNSMDFLKIRKPSNESNDPVYLYPSELKSVHDFDFEGMPITSGHDRLHISTMRNARDIFCFACYTGQRYSDIQALKWTDIVHAPSGNEWHVYQVKGNKRLKVVVPIGSKAQEILDRQPKEFAFVFNAPSGQKYNDSLKELGKACGLDRIVTKVRYSGKKRIESALPLYELLSSHKARATFVTLLKTQKVSDKTIMGMTGHTDVRTMMRYEGVSDEAKRNAVREAFD